MGAWIEIKINGKVAFTVIVAPLVGAWIEMMNMLEEKKMEQVAPLVGAWIEIHLLEYDHIALSRRSPRGSVD